MEVTGNDIRTATAGQNKAGVSKEGRLYTEALTSNTEQQASQDQRSFIAYTGEINISAGGDNTRKAIFYIKNEEQEVVTLTNIVLGSSKAGGTATDDIVLIESVGNILSTDAIVASGADVEPANNYLGSAKSFNGIVKKGPQTQAANGQIGTGVKTSLVNGKDFSLNLVIPRGQSIGIEVEPPENSSEMLLTAAISFSIGL